MSTDHSNLQIEVEEQEAWRRRLTVTVPAGSVQTERTKIIQKLGGKLKLPGFRKGKIPSNVVEQRFGQALDQELLDKVIGDAYREAIQAHSLEPISEGKVEDVDYKPREDLTFSISFDIQPEIELERLGGFSVERRPIAVAQEDIDRVLGRLQDEAGVWKPVEEGPAAEGNLVTLDILRLEDGEPVGESRPYEIVLGDGEAIPEVEAAVRTLGVGETGDFTVTFPEDFPDEERRGEKEHLRITLEAQKVKEVPELTDEFAKSLGDFEDVVGMTDRIKEDLEKEAESQTEQMVRTQLIDSILDANPFEVPRSMAERYMESVLGDTSKLDPEVIAETQERLRPEAEKAVKRILIVDRIAELQGLKASEDEVDDRIQDIADKNDVKPAQVYANLQKAGNIDALEREITEGKVYDFLKAESTVTETD